jgi:gas vesicle protein
MSDALIGVVVGGLIAWVAPLLALRFTERKWRFEAKLAYLKAERDRFEKLYEVNLERFGDGVKENSSSSEMAAEVFSMMPKEIGDHYETWMAVKDKDDQKRKVAYLKMASLMKKDLAKRDREIRNLFDDIS